jgi:hypothetical protein
MRELVGVEEFIRYLDRRGTRWTDSKELTIAFQCHKRHICKLADESDGRVISSPNGYKLLDHATREEVMAAYKHFADLIDALQARCSALMTRFHGREKAAGENPNQMRLI